MNLVTPPVIRSTRPARVGWSWGRLAVFSCFLWLAAVPAWAQENPYAENYFRMLTERGVPTDAEGLRGFLKTHIPGPEDENRFQELLKDLGADDYARREAAMQSLLARPPKSTDELEKLVNGDDPEIRWRARLVLDHMRQPGNDLLYASLIVIYSRKIEGLADVVVGIAPLCQSDSMQLAMSRALVATATAKDADILKTGLKSEDARLRMASLNALITATGEAAVAEVLPLLGDKSDLVRLEAANQLLRYKRGDALKTLGQLLLSDQLTVRNRSIHLLRSTLKVSLPYSGYEPPEDRARHAAEWQKTIEANLEEKPATTTSTASPAPFSPQLVLSSGLHNALILVAKDGAVTALRRASSPARVTAAGNGHLLVCHPQQMLVTETDVDNKTVWQSRELDERPIVAVRRSDGNTLVATESDSLLELNANGDLLRKTAIRQATDLEPLPGGNVLLISFVDRKLEEIDRAGRVQWSMDLPLQPTSLCVTRDGRALVTLIQSQKVLAVDVASHKADEIPTSFSSPSQIEQTDDGRLIVLDDLGVHRADQKLTLIETFRLFPIPSDGQ